MSPIDESKSRKCGNQPTAVPGITSVNTDTLTNSQAAPDLRWIVIMGTFHYFRAPGQRIVETLGDPALFRLRIKHLSRPFVLYENNQNGYISILYVTI